MSNIKIQTFNGQNYTQQNPYSYYSENSDKLDNCHADDFVKLTSYQAGCFSIGKVFDKDFSYTGEVLSDTVLLTNPESIMFLIEKVTVFNLSTINSSARYSTIMQFGHFSQIKFEHNSYSETFTSTNTTSTAMVMRSDAQKTNQSNNNDISFGGTTIRNGQFRYQYFYLQEHRSMGNLSFSANVKLFAVKLYSALS